jgi:hypothetical protein
MAESEHPVCKYAARLNAGERTLEVRAPARLSQGDVVVTIDGVPAVTEADTGGQTDAFQVVGSSIILDTPLETGGIVEVTFSDT